MNYHYDKIGNLKKDIAEGIDTIRWTVYGKINKIVKSAANTNITYDYDATGNRTSKKVISGDTTNTTFYVRDAQGNVMSIYSKKNNGNLNWDEQHLYGSSRLGIWRWNNAIPVNPPNVIESSISDSLLYGTRNYELTNHLGNVLATISDKKIGHPINDTTVDYFNADVVNANDYYPGGMQQPGRKYQAGSGSYRYGFNGKENDNEVKGEGNQQDYGNRIYDTRLGKFLSVDPLQKNFPALSSYQFSGNNPIATIDLDGLEPAAVNKGTEALVIILQGFAVNPPDGSTQASNADKIISGLGPDNALGAIGSSGPKLQVVVYASSTTDNSKNDVLSTIKNFRSINPNGKVILVGHSQGADNIVELAKSNKEVKLDLIITLDIKDAGGYGIMSIDDNIISSNVKNAINYYQEGEFIGGEKIDVANKNKTSGINILSPGSNHRSIDNDLQPYIIGDINNFLKGKDAVKEAKERKLPVFDPAATGSKDITGPSKSAAGGSKSKSSK